MARKSAVWGIDIGQCALKALRCRAGDDPAELVAEAFDYIEYPKILSQPEANAEELIRDAFTQFLSRNSVRGDRVAISVSGQSGLARFIKLPPVESKKIPDIVKYEARQQIPFALEDVVWDYQQMAGGSEEEGFALETEVGLFAMKREQVFRALAPFDNAGIEVDFVQLAPLALYNFVAFDQMQDLPPADQYDAENPPPSVVILSLGTDTTDLVITNGYRVWQRNVPIGGNHFTRALTKELKLTFAKAEHVKRNASAADDAKAVFQAMRPVFNDLLTQVQRSITYFNSIDRRAKIGRVLALGNGMKLPGLQRYLQQNLGMEVQRLEKLRGLSGADVIDAPAFKDNILSFATCYGLSLQGLADTKIHTNLVPRELVKDRLIRGKKPWAIAAASLLMLGFTLNAFGHWNAWRSSRIDGYFDDPMRSAETAASTAARYQSEFDEAKTAFQKVAETGDRVVHSVEGRAQWLEIMKAIDSAIPRDPDALSKPLEELWKREEIHVESIDCLKLPSLDGWYTGVKQWGPLAPPKPPQPVAPAGQEPGAEVPAEAAVPAEAVAGEAAPPVEDPGPSGPGWVFQIRGYHYHNREGDMDSAGEKYLRKTLLKNLAEQKIMLPGPDGKPRELTMAEIGIAYPVLIDPKRIEPRPLDEKEGTPPVHVNAKGMPVRRFDFVVQFCWRDPHELQAAGAAPAENIYD